MIYLYIASTPMVGIWTNMCYYECDYEDKSMGGRVGQYVQW